MSATAPTPREIDSRSLFERMRYTPVGDALRGRITGRLHIAHHIEHAGLPAPLPGLVLTVARRTRLWRAERVEVTRELCAHFRDGLESGASAAELAGLFGDATQAAKLIRRAKKRNRPLIRRAFRNSARAVAVLAGFALLVYVSLALRFVIGTPTVAVDYRAQLNYVAKGVPEQERAWPMYRESLIRMGRMPDDAWWEGGNYNREPRPGEDGWESFNIYLRDHARDIQQLRVAALKPGLGFVADYQVQPEDQRLWPDMKVSGGSQEGLYAILLPHLSSLRKVSRLLIWDALRAASEKNSTTAMADIVAVLGIVRQARETPCLINDLVSLAIFNLTLLAAGDLLGGWSELLSDDQLRDLGHRLASFDDRSLEVRIDFERLGFEDLLQRVYTDDGRGDGRVTLSGMRKLNAIRNFTGGPLGWLDDDALGMVAGPAASMMLLGRRDMHNEFERLLNMAALETSTPLWRRTDSQVERELSAITGSPIELARKFPIGMLLPSLVRAGVETELTRTTRDGVLAAIASNLYRRQQGRWPDRLDELVPGYLPALPMDCYNGQPLRFAIRNDRPVIYSVGTDRDDDGGREPQDQAGTLLVGAARDWIPPKQMTELHGAGPVSARMIPDGDWIVWPPNIEPLRRFNVNDP